jgi:hypothetical protein
MDSTNVQFAEAGKGMYSSAFNFKSLEPPILFLLLLLTWCFLPQLIQGDNPTAGIVDQAMWPLPILSLISFFLICGISWWLVKHFWLMLGLPDLENMVKHFNTLLLWQQLSFFLVSFVSLLLAAMGCLLAIC